MRDEHLRRQSNTNKVAAFFKARPGEWIDAADLERVGGRQAWRTRVSECRRQLAMTIENRQARVMKGRECVKVVTEYRYLPFEPLGRDAGAPTQQPRLI